MTQFEGLYAEGHTILLVTHDPDFASRARRTVVLRDGRIESDRPNPSPVAVPA